MRKKLHFFAVGILFFALPFLANAQKKFVSDAIWTEINEKAIPPSGTRYITPKTYKTYKLNINALKNALDIAPMEFTPVAQMTKTYLELPMPDGSIKTFDIVESPIMAPELAEKFPGINTYAGYAVDDNNITVRFDFTLQGFHAMIMIPGQSTIFIDPYSFGGGDLEHYVVYHRRDYASSVPKSFECGVTETYIPRSTNNEPDLKSAFGSCELRTYRLALAATGEYTAFHGGTVALALSAQNTSMNRVNAVYGREMAIRMNIIANNNLIIYTNAGSDPYTNNNGATMLNENQTNLTNVIGGANYDIGHVFSTGGGGIAQLGSVCVASGKARGVTGSPAPIGDAFDIDYVAHEIGHQFACNHTFNNSDDGSCAGNTNTTTSMEPGSGSTIMAYAGICAPSNVQNNSNDYFHVISLQEMGNFITSAGHTCPVKTTLSNSTPSVTTASSAIVIPQGTPFFLTANGTDPNPSNVLTYCWEQTNTGTATTSPSATATTAANFRSFNPTTNPTRFFPSLSALAANGPFTWEVLPTVARTMTFRVTVRDNATGGGCTAATSNVTVTVNSATGPFTVTNPTNTGISWVGATTQTITWNVANTTNAPVSCANVDILISTDGGVTYTVLLANTPNDGTQAITAPNTPSTTCRIMVRCAGGNFFDISNNNFTITAATNDYTISVTNPSVNVCQPNNAVYNITSTSIGGYINPITLSLTGLPAGGTATFGTNPITPGNGTTLTISGTGTIAPGTYNMTLVGNSTSGTKNVSLTLVVSTGSPTAVTLLAPANGATNVALPVNFSWTAASGTGVSYAIQVSPNATFTPITDQASGITVNSYSSVLLSPSTTYFWRVTASSGCGTAPASATFSFTTGQSGCDTISNYDTATDTARLYSAGAGNGYVAGHNIYGDLAKADKYTYTGPNTHLKGAYIGFGRARASNSTNTFFARVWDGTTGSPTTVLASVPITYQSIQTLINGGNSVAFVSFGSVPLPASKIFFVGVEFTYGADTIALITNTNGQTTPATAWEKFSNGTWVPYSDPSSWPLNVAHYIFPVLGTPPNAAYTPVTANICAGNSLSLTNTSTAAATYAWSFTGGSPATSTALNPSVSYSAPGSYNIQLIATNDCLSDTAVSTVNVSAVSVTVNSTNVSCNGGSNGSANAVGAGGTTPYTFSWSNGRTTASNTGLSAGIYSVTVTDVNSCSTTQSVTITQPSAITATDTNTNVSCNGGANGTATITSSGGTTPYSFLWSNGRTTASNTGLTAGTYTVTVTDGGNCTAIRSVTITQPSAITATATNTNASCNGSANGSATVTTSGGTSPYAFNWSNGRTTASNTGLTAGTYTVTVSDANACSVTRSVTVTQPTAITATTTNTNVSCNGGTNGSATVTASGGTAPYAFNWSNGRTTASNTGLTAGTYTVTITDAIACSVTRSVTVTQPSALGATTTVNNISCNGGTNGSATVVGAGGTTPYSYSWSNGRTTASNTGLTVGTYTVTITDANNCTAIASATITQPSAITASITNSNVSCNGGNNGSATASAIGGTSPYTFLWSNGVATATNTGLPTGVFICTFTDANGCSTSRSVTITQPSAVTATTTSTNPTCNGGSNGNASVSASGGTAPYAFNWSNGRTTASNTGLTAGVYTVVVTDANNCSVTRSVTLTQPSAISISTTSTPQNCNPNTGTASATANGGTGALSYLWSTGAISSSINSLNTGTYTVTVTDANLCTAIATVTVGNSCVPCTLSGSATNVNVSCNGGSNGSATAIPAAGTAPYSFNWSNGRTTAANSGLTAGTYSVTITDANNCTATASATITQPSAITATATNTNLSCNGASNASASVTAAGGTLPYSFNWGAGVTSQTRTGLAAGTYTATITDANGCSATRTVTVTQPSAITATTTSTNPTCNGGSNGNASVSASGGTAPYAFNWSNGRTTANNTGLSAGVYTVVVTDANNCSVTRSVTITQPSAISITTTSTPQNCNPNTGTASATASGGTGALSYLWSTGAISSSINSLNTGTYTVTVTDANLCTAIATVTVGNSCVPCTLLGSISNVNVSCNGGSNGSATAVPASGTTPYSFLWSNGRTTATNSGLSAGTYTVTITDANNCTATASATITQPSAITATATNTNVSCNGGSNASASVTAAGGASPYAFNWGAGATSQTRTGLAAGTYTATVTDANGCSTTRTVTVTQPSAITATTTSTNPSCNGGSNGSAIATANGGTAPYAFIWSNGRTTANNTGLSAGVYTLIVTDANNCSATASTTVSQQSAISITTASTPQNCNPNTGTASATANGGTGALSYLWNTGATTNNINSLNSGTYTVTVTDVNLCTAITTVSVGNSCVSCTLGGTTNSSNVSCNGGSNGVAIAAGASGTLPYSYVWSNGQSGAQISGLSAGIYTVTISDANNCTATVSVTVSQPSAITVSTTSTPQNCSPNTGTAFATATGGSGSLNYSWNNGVNTPVNNNLSAGSYSVTVIDANGCSASGSVVVGINCSSTINTTELIERFAVLPNPSNGHFSIQIELNSFEQINLRMTDVLGRTIEEMQLEGKSFTIPMDWDRLAGGTYFITLYSGGKFKTEKVVISK